MSRRSLRWKRELAKAGGKADAILPTRRVLGRGTYLQYHDTAFVRAPHRERNPGAVCSLPMSDAKEARVRSYR